MMYVGVRHKPGQDKLYWFRVPEALEQHVRLGSKVVCDTRRGSNEGTIVSILNGVTEDDMFAVAKCGRMEVKSIIAVHIEPDIKTIHIPYDMGWSEPPPEKISKRCGKCSCNDATA